MESERWHSGSARRQGSHPQLLDFCFLVLATLAGDSGTTISDSRCASKWCGKPLTSPPPWMAGIPTESPLVLRESLGSSSNWLTSAEDNEEA